MVIKKNSSSTTKSTSGNVHKTTEILTSNPGGGQTIVTKTIHTPNLLQTSSSSSSVMKSMSSEKQVFSTSSKSSSSSTSKNYVGSGGMQIRTTDAFLRGERVNPNIDNLHSTKVIDSVDLQTISTDIGHSSDLKNLVSVEIEESKTRVGGSSMQSSSSMNEVITNINTTSDGNRNDVIHSHESERKVISGRNNDNNTVANISSTSYSSSDVKQSFESSSSSSFMESKNGTVTNSGSTSSSKSKNMESSIKMKDGQIVDQRGISDLNTTFTSKIFDDKTKTWVVVDQSSMNEKGKFLPANNNNANNILDSSQSQSVSISEVVDNNNRNQNFVSSSMTSSASDFATSSNIAHSSSTTNIIDNKSSSIRSDFTKNSSTKEVIEKTLSNKTQSARNEKLISTKTNETMQVFDNKTKTWKQIDESTFNKQKRPSYVRYRSQNEDGSWHTIYKRKLFDNFSKQWRVVEEKVIDNETGRGADNIPDLIESSTNITTTTYTTKVYDTKTGKWTVIEEKSYVDKEPVNVTQDIRREMEIDEADLANIITTTETTKVS
jgi:hypothetical protein